MDRARVLLPRIDPRPDHFKDKKIVPGRHSLIDHFALEVGITLAYHRRFDARSLDWRQMERFEFIDCPAGSIAARHRLLR